MIVCLCIRVEHRTQGALLSLHFFFPSGLGVYLHFFGFLRLLCTLAVLAGPAPDEIPLGEGDSSLGFHRFSEVVTAVTQRERGTA